jgi:hypothetical protein
MIIPEQSGQIIKSPPVRLSRSSRRSLFVERPLPVWRTLRRLRIAVCPYPNCKLYTVAYSINIDGSAGDAIGPKRRPGNVRSRAAVGGIADINPACTP